MALQPWPRIHAPAVVVTAAQMQAIEAQVFAAGMPVAALMEKVAGLITRWLVETYPSQTHPRVGILAGPGHNGGDALVVARELHGRGYGVRICSPFSRHKPLTADHLRYAQHLGLPVGSTLASLGDVEVLVDGLFGFGLERPITGDLAQLVAAVNDYPSPVVSIDLPSGLHTDSGEVLGTAIQATHTLCLGLWKRAFCQDAALGYVGQAHRLDWDIPDTAIAPELGANPQVRRITKAAVVQRLPLPRRPDTHKYRVGQLLLVAGSRSYGGAALLSGLGARGSGVGMVTLAVPESLRLMAVAQLPEALVIGCPETDDGAIAHLPDDLDLSRYDAIALGPGLSKAAGLALDAALASPTPLVLDADGLNLLAEGDRVHTLAQRSAPTLLTPHIGEFKRLFPRGLDDAMDTGEAAQAAAAQSQAVVLLKGACTAIAAPDGQLWYGPPSTPALARGGSGDVLTGLVGGLLAQYQAKAKQTGEPAALDHALNAAIVATWWHAQAGTQAAQARTQLGVYPTQLASYLPTTLAQELAP
jgi:hydroxyethylthiazole kinase-like uncharacterized protein yjeF